MTLSLPVCACPQRQHIKSWPACMEREQTTENISSLLCQTPARPSILFPSINLSFLCFPSLHLIVSLSVCQVLPMHTHLFSQPVTAFWLFSNSKCALKAPVRLRVREYMKDQLLLVKKKKKAANLFWNMNKTASFKTRINQSIGSIFQYNECPK